MRFVELWQMPDQKSYVLLQVSVLETFKRYRQCSIAATEAGGVLLGYVRGGHLEVISATPPQPGDVRRRTRYDRNDKTHQEMADLLWEKSDGGIRYLGEWHTHPEDMPTPSGIDISGWQHRAAQRLDARPNLGVIVGRESLYVSLIDKEGRTYRCLACQA